MVKRKKIKERIKQGVREIKEKGEELEELEEALDDEVVNEEGLDDEGIFDEDLEFVEGGDVSDFNVADTLILSAAKDVPVWAGQNLEDDLNREWIQQKGWQTEDELVTGSVYDAANSGGVYGASLNDAYGVGDRKEGVYDGASSGSYAEKSGEGTYGAKGKGIKTYSEEDSNRGSKSMLESGGFKDEDTQKKRDLRASDKYQSRNAM